MRKSLVVLILMLAVMPAFAAEPLMGNWEGVTTDAQMPGLKLTMQVIGQSGGQYKAMLNAVPDDHPALSWELKGFKNGDAGAILGEITVEERWGGKYLVTATAVNDVMIGSFQGTVDKKDVAVAFEMKRVRIQPPTLGQAAPEGATVLFDGSNLDAWEKQPGDIQDGAMQICAKNNFVSKQLFGDGLYHIEFMCPYMPEASGQGRGNSGIYIQQRYEIQVLDSFGDAPADSFCGGIYKIAVPLVSASLPPGEWQTYDITFTAPKFDAAGAKTQNARLTAYLNGVLIHDNIELPNATAGGIEQEAPLGPIFLQMHNDAVQYRNIWVKPLS